MMFRTRTLVAAAVVATTAVVAGAVWAGAVSLSEVPSAQELAVDAVKRMPEVGSVQSVEEIVAPNGRAQQLEVRTDRGTILWLDQVGRTIGSSGAVARAQRELPLSLESARAEATEFVASQYPDLGQLGSPVAIKVSEDAYIFAWDERSDEGIRLGRSASVRVNLKSGSLRGYSAKYDRPQVSSMVPVVDERKVRSIFASDPDHRLDTIKAVTLEVREDSKGAGRLVWCVDYRVGLTYPDGKVVESTGMVQFFDALTGSDITAELY